MGRRSTVAASALEPQIKELLVSGWSAQRIHAYLADQYGEAMVPSPKAMDRYRKAHIPPREVLPASLIKQALKGVRHRADVIKSLDDKIGVLEMRVSRLWEREQETGLDEPRLDTTFRTLLEYLKERHRIAMELGLRPPGRRGRPRRRAQEEQPQDASPEVQVREIMDLLRKHREQREAALATSNRKRSAA